MKIHRLVPLLAAAAAAFVSGCQMPAIQFTPAQAPAITQKIDATMSAVAVDVAAKAERKGDLNLAAGEVKSVTEAWRGSLDATLKRTALWSGAGARRVSVRVTVLEFDRPVMGFAMRVRTTARYEVVDAAGGAVVFKDEIVAEGVAGATAAYPGGTRVSMAENLAVQKSVTMFIERLAEKGLAPAK